MENRERVGLTLSSWLCGLATMNTWLPPPAGAQPFLPADHGPLDVRAGIAPRRYTRRRFLGRHPLWGTGVTSWIPATSRPSAASWAANGVDFREPLNPTLPALAQERVLP